jgi:DNA polymerase III alpha subunit (gram-positive type)
MREFVFADCETTGLDAQNDLLVELTYAVGNDSPKTLFFGVQRVPAFIDELTKFSVRKVYDEPAATQGELAAFRLAMMNNTLVAANPAFDKRFMEENGLWTGHYRMLDIESFAMGKLGLAQVPSMHEIVDILTSKGYSLTKPDHSSLNDTLALREAFTILRYL